MTDIPIGELRLECDYCGSADLSVADDVTEGSPIVCNSCGTTLATVGDLKARAVRVGRAQMPEALPFVSFADLMARVGNMMFYWSTLERALTDAISAARVTAGQPAGRGCGSFNKRLDSWCALVTALPQNALKADLIAQIREQALSLREMRNTIVHGLMAGSSMQDVRPAYIVCTIGGYDNPTGETVEYTIDDLEHFSKALDACRRAFLHLDAFNYTLETRCLVR